MPLAREQIASSLVAADRAKRAHSAVVTTNPRSVYWRFGHGQKFEDLVYSSSLCA